MTSCVNVCDVKSAEKRYDCLNFVNNKTKMTCVSSHRCLGSPVVRKKEFRLKGFISLEEINLSRQKQNYRFYLFDKSWYFPAKHVICLSYDVASGSEITPCNKIDKPLVVYRFTANVMTSITTLRS